MSESREEIAAYLRSQGALLPDELKKQARAKEGAKPKKKKK